MTLTCRVVTPDATYFDGEVERVVVPASTGDFAFYSSHAPLIAQLGNGVLRAHTSSGVEHIVIFGGFVKVKDNVVLVLAGGAEKVADIDKATASEALSKAKAAVEAGRPPKSTEAEYALLQEDFVKAEVRNAAVQGTPVPIH